MATARIVEHRTAPVRIWRSYRRTMLIALVSVVYAITLALNSATLLTPPRLVLVLGTAGAGVVRLAWDRPGSALWDHGVRWGDRVLVLDGHAPTRRDTGLWVGEQLSVRGATGVTAVTAAALRSGHDPTPLLLLSPWFFLLGTLVVLRAPQPHVGRAAYAFLIGAAYALALAPAADADEPLAGVAEFAMVPLFATFFVRFFLTFPQSHGTRLRRAALVVLLVIIALGLAGLVWPAISTVAASMRLVVVLVYLLVGAGMLAYACTRERDSDLRQGLVIMSVGTVAGVLPFALFYLVPTLLHRPALTSSEHAILAIALLPASFAYAILRHHTLRVPLLQRWLVHGLLWAILLALYATIIYGLRTQQIVDVSAFSRSPILAVALVLRVGVSFRWAYDALWRCLDRLIFKDAYDYRSALQRLSHDLSLAGDVSVLGTSLPAELRRLINLDFVVLLVEDSSGALAVCGTAGAYPPALLPELVAAAHEVRVGPGVIPLAYGYPSVLFVPLRAQDALVGHLCLGPKASAEPFRAEDQALLATLSGHLGAIVRNAQLVDELRVQVGVLQTQKATLDVFNERLQGAQEEERARLAADLHDEPLQTAQHLQRQLVADGRARAATVQHVALCNQMIAQLRTVVQTARPAALDELGLAAALEVLALELGAHAGVLIALDADPELAEVTLSPTVDLVLYRTAQEALNNALRHARPSSLQITLLRRAGVVRLLVADDGVGFTVPSHPNGLIAAGHLGLGSQRHRVQRAGGHVSIISSPGQGTVVQVEFPVSSTEGATA